MSPFLRKIRTASGATAVQIADKTGGRYRIIEHLGSAHTPAELAVLIEGGNQKLHPGQATLDFNVVDKPAVSTAVVKGSRSRILIDTIRTAYEHLGFDVVEDEVFYDLVLALIVEPTPKSDSVRVLDELGATVAHRNTFLNCLKRAQDRDYRSSIASNCLDYSIATTGSVCCSTT